MTPEGNSFMRHFAVLMLVLFTAVTAWPQTSNSTVRGIVRDQAQAVVPGAAVTLTNIATNGTRTTQSNESGLYVFPGINPGPYRLVVEFSGMQRFEGTLTVQVQQDADVNVAMQLAQTTTQVEVQDLTPMLKVDTIAARSCKRELRLTPAPPPPPQQPTATGGSSPSARVRE